MAEEDTTQTPAPVVEPTATPPEAATAPTEPEAVQSEPQPAEPQTAQIPASEPLPPEVEPFDSAQDKPIAPTPAPEPPQATSASATPAPAPTSTSSPQATQAARDLLVKARATIQDRKRKKLDKIMEALNTKGKITNDEVEKLLHVSDATATRYLSALEKEGKIQQVGKTGKAVEYTRI